MRVQLKSAPNSATGPSQLNLWTQGSCVCGKAGEPGRDQHLPAERRPGPSCPCPHPMGPVGPGPSACSLERHSFLACGHTVGWLCGCPTLENPSVAEGGGTPRASLADLVQMYHRAGPHVLSAPSRLLTSSRRSMLAFRQGVQDLSSPFSSSSCCSLRHKNKAGTSYPRNVPP